MVVNNIIILIALVCINGVFVQMYFGPLFAVPIEILGTRTAGMSGGFSNFFANIGSFSFVYLLGILKDTTGFLILAFMLLLGFALLAWRSLFSLHK